MAYNHEKDGGKKKKQTHWFQYVALLIDSPHNDGNFEANRSVGIQNIPIVGGLCSVPVVFLMSV